MSYVSLSGSGKRRGVLLSQTSTSCPVDEEPRPKLRDVFLYWEKQRSSIVTITIAHGRLAGHDSYITPPTRKNIGFVSHLRIVACCQRKDQKCSALPFRVEEDCTSHTALTYDIQDAKIIGIYGDFKVKENAKYLVGGIPAVVPIPA